MTLTAEFFVNSSTVDSVPTPRAPHSHLSIALLILIVFAWAALVLFSGRIEFPPVSGEFDRNPGLEKLTAEPPSCEVGDRNGMHSYELSTQGAGVAPLVRLHAVCSGWDFLRPGLGDLDHPFAAAADLDGDGILEIVFHNPPLTRLRSMHPEYLLLESGDWYVGREDQRFVIKPLPFVLAVRFLYPEQMSGLILTLALLLFVGRRVVRTRRLGESRQPCLLAGAWILVYACAASWEAVRPLLCLVTYWVLVPISLIVAVVQLEILIHPRSRSFENAVATLLTLSTIWFLGSALAEFPFVTEPSESRQSCRLCNDALRYSAIQSGLGAQGRPSPASLPEDPQALLAWMEGSLFSDTSRLLWNWHDHYRGLRWEGELPDGPRPLLFDHAANHTGLGRNVLFSNGEVRLMRGEEFRILMEKYRNRFPEETWRD